MKPNFKIHIKNFHISNSDPIVLIAGPCQMESMEHSFHMIGSLKEITDDLKINFIYKTSFDKANRTSWKTKRGVGIEKAIDILSMLKKNFDCPILTDVHSEKHCSIIAPFVDIIQIPAFLCRQTDLLFAAAKTGRIINIKKGQFLAPWDMKNVVEKVLNKGNKNVMVCERGSSFGYNTLISDIRSLPIMAKLGFPVIFDATHSVQRPGGKQISSDGDRKFVEILSYAATAVGIAGIFLETHQDPDLAPSDGPNMIKLNNLKKILEKILKFDCIAKNLQK